MCFTFFLLCERRQTMRYDANFPQLHLHQGRVFYIKVANCKVETVQVWNETEAKRKKLMKYSTTTTTTTTQLNDVKFSFISDLFCLSKWNTTMDGIYTGNSEVIYTCYKCVLKKVFLSLLDYAMCVCIEVLHYITSNTVVYMFRR